MMNVAPSESLTSDLDALRARGYVILKDLVPVTCIERVSEELEPWLAATPRCRGDFYGWNTTRCGSVLLKSVNAQQLVVHERLLALMEAVLGPHCDWYQLNLSQVIRIHPGERQQIPHRDEEMWPCTSFRGELLVNVMWALSEFTRANGATRVWSRSHYQRSTRSLDEADAIAAEMSPGSALVYLGSVMHAGGANVSAAPRTGLVFSYCLGWLKQYENAFLSFPPEVASQFPEQIRNLLGYRIHKPNLGNYEGQDPSVLFKTRSHTLATVDAIPEEIAAELQAFYQRDAAKLIE